MTFPQNVMEAFAYDQFEKYKVKEGPRGTEICFNGPFEPDTRFRMSINVPMNVVHDFNTGYSNTFLGFVSDLLDMSTKQAQEYIVKTYLSYLSFKDIIKPYKTPIKVIKLAKMNEPPGLMTITNKTELGKLAIKFLFNKNISPQTVKRFGLKYFPSNYYKARLYIPFYMNHELVFFQARDLLGEDLFFKVHKRKRKYRKYLNPKGIQKSQIVYNYDSILEGGTVVVVEGPFDAMTVKNGVAILGNTISKPQAKKIAEKNPKKIIFVPDNDEAGRSTLIKNIKIMKEIAPEIEVGYYELDSRYKDANEAGLKEVEHHKVKTDHKTEMLRGRILDSAEKKGFTMSSGPSYNVLKERLKHV